MGRKALGTEELQAYARKFVEEVCLKAPLYKDFKFPIETGMSDMIEYYQGALDSFCVN